MLAVIGLLQLLAPLPSPARLAVAVATEPAKRGGLCWRARPAPRCSWFLITEFGLSALGRPDSYGPRMDVELGLMANLGAHSAVGAAWLLSGDESHERRGFTVRYRRWLSPRLALEAGAGPATYCELSGPGGCGERGQSGFQLAGSAHLWGLMAATATFEHLGAARSHVGWVLPEQNRWYTGIKFGGFAAPIAAVALVILVAATWN
jgi:hypothetical protein